MGDDTKNGDNNIVDDNQLGSTGGGIGGVERGPAGDDGVDIKEVPGKHKELEKSKEISEYVKEVPARSEIPRKVERITGDGHAGQTVPLKKKKNKVQLPLTDDEIITGLHAHMWQSVRWLAIWCVRKLKKARIAVKEVHGKLVRG
jgi:hypothetical protein